MLRLHKKQLRNLVLDRLSFVTQAADFVGERKNLSSQLLFELLDVHCDNMSVSWESKLNYREIAFLTLDVHGRSLRHRFDKSNTLSSNFAGQI